MFNGTANNDTRPQSTLTDAGVRPKKFLPGVAIVLVDEVCALADAGGMQLCAQDVHDCLLAVAVSVRTPACHGVRCAFLFVLLKLPSAARRGRLEGRLMLQGNMFTTVTMQLHLPCQRYKRTTDWRQRYPVSGLRVIQFHKFWNVCGIPFSADWKYHLYCLYSVMGDIHLNSVSDNIEMIKRTNKRKIFLQSFQAHVPPPLPFPPC